MRKSLVDAEHTELSIRSQCDLLSIPRSTLYYKPKPEKPENLELMEMMDRHLTDHPTEGVVSMVLMYKALGFLVGPKRIRRLMRLMGRETIFQRKNLTKSGLKAYIKPYLLKDLNITRANQVWCTDITYIPMRHGFMYLTAFIDVYSRKIVGWGLNNTMDTEWCLEVLEHAIATHGCPEIINSDQGSQYTSSMWQSFMDKNVIRISMDGKGRALDNVWIERFWKSVKYDHVYLNPVDDGIELWIGINGYISYYNLKIHHTTREAPAVRYQESIQLAA